MNKVKHFLSYLYPVLIESRSGELSGHLEVRKSRGKYILDSLTVNYSYGGLQQLFDSLFYTINLKERNFNNVLLLGMGAGSVVALLREKYGKKCKITAIENDAVVIELAKKYFNVQRFSSLKIIKEDAFKFVSETKDKFDLIIVDLFIDTEVPEVFTTPEFVSNVRKIATHDCNVIFNKTTDTYRHKKEFENLFLEFEHCFPGSEVIKLISYSMENSFIFYSVLPLILRTTDPIKKKNPGQDPWVNFKPSYTFYNNKINSGQNNFINCPLLQN